MSDAYWMGLNTINSFNNANLNTFNQNMGNAAANQYAMIGSPPPYQSPVAFGDYNYGTVGGYPSFGEAIYPGYGPRGDTGTPSTAEQPFSPNGGAGGYTPLPSNSFDERFPMANAGEASVFNNPSYFPQQYPDVIGNGGYPTLDQRWQPLNEPYYNQPLNDALFQRGSGAQIGPQVEPGRFTAPPSQERLAPETGYPDFSNEQFPLEAMDRWRQSMNAMPGGVPMPQARPDSAPQAGADFSSRFQFQTPTPQERPAEAPPMSTGNPVTDRWMPGGDLANQWPEEARNRMAEALMAQGQRASNSNWTYEDVGSRGFVGPQQDFATSYPYSANPYLNPLNPNNTVQYRFPQTMDATDAQRLLDQIDRATARQELDTLGPERTFEPPNTLRGSDFFFGSPGGG